MIKTIKELEKEFKELHIKCVEETKTLGKAKYITHGKRCEALGKLETLKEVLELIDDYFMEERYKTYCDFQGWLREDIKQLKQRIKGGKK